MTALQVHQSDKALPSVKDSLPPIPPQHDAPQLPPKSNPHYDPAQLSNGLRLPPPIDIVTPDEFLGQGGALRSFLPPASHPARFH